MIGNILPLLMAVVYLVCIKVISRDGVPSITLWFLLMCVGAGFCTLNVVAGPLLYDFIPKDKIGTLSSGFGLLSTALGAVFSTLVGTWIYYYSHWSSGGATTKDYTSTYVMQITFGMGTLVLTVILARRMLAGKMVEYGRLGLNSNGLPPELLQDHPKEGTPTAEPQGGPQSEPERVLPLEPQPIPVRIRTDQD
jgi:MFS family permease